MSRSGNLFLKMFLTFRGGARSLETPGNAPHCVMPLIQTIWADIPMIPAIFRAYYLLGFRTFFKRHFWLRRIAI